MEDYLRFDTYQIDEDIMDTSKSNESVVEGSKFILYRPKDKPDITVENADPSFKYVADIDTKQFKYKGILSEDLIRVKYGMNIYSTSDKYIGEWLYDKKHGRGVYQFHIENDQEQQLYFGEWNQGEKKGKGMYLWKHSNASVEQLSSSSYDAFFANFDSNNITKGISVKKSINTEGTLIDKIIYCGGISQEGKKEDENAVLIENNNCFLGQFSNDQMVKGTVIIFEQEKDSQEEKVQKSYFFEKKEGEEYKFDLKKENNQSEIEKALKVKAHCKNNDFFSSIEKLYQEYLNLEKQVNDHLELFHDYESLSFFITLKQLLNDDQNFCLI